MKINSIFTLFNLFAGTVALLIGVAVFFYPDNQDKDIPDIAAKIADAEKRYFQHRERYVLFSPESSEISKAFKKLDLPEVMIDSSFLFEVCPNDLDEIVVRVLPDNDTRNGKFIPAMYEYNVKNKSGQWVVQPSNSRIILR